MAGLRDARAGGDNTGGRLGGSTGAGGYRVARTRRVDGVALAYVAAARVALSPVVLMQWRKPGTDLPSFVRRPAGVEWPSLPWFPVVNAIADILAKLPEPAAELILNVVSVTIVGVVLVILSIRWRRSKDTWTLLAWGWSRFWSRCSPGS